MTYKNKFGALYNSYAVNTGKLCPTGWHVPSYEEFKNLVTYVQTNGHQGMEGSALKSISGWDDDYKYSLDSITWDTQTIFDTISGNGTDYFGWNGLAGGVRHYDGDFYGIGEESNWWSSTDELNGDAWVLSLETDSLVDFYGEDKEEGAYVRCLKD